MGGGEVSITDQDHSGGLIVRVVDHFGRPSLHVVQAEFRLGDESEGEHFHIISSRKL